MREGISEAEIATWFAVCGKIRENLERYQRKTSDETEYDQATGETSARVQEGRAAHPVFRDFGGRDGVVIPTVMALLIDRGIDGAISARSGNMA